MGLFSRMIRSSSEFGQNGLHPVSGSVQGGGEIL